MQLPPPLDRALGPVLDALVPTTEPLAPCASCVMASPAAPGRPSFSAPARCCTHHPKLANFLVGHALEQGGIGADRVRTRLHDPSGVGPLGIDPSATYRARRLEIGYQVGNDEQSTCPYWVPGDLGCSIHLSRNAICRTWFCRMSQGRRAYDAWMAVRDVIGALERALAEQVALEPPEQAPDVAPEAWQAYFTGCASRARDLGDDVLAELVERPKLERARSLAAQRDRPLPDRPIPSISGTTMRETHVELESFSAFDPFFAPPWIFQLLSRLDGETHWVAAIRATAEAIDEPVSPDLVLQLWNRGLLTSPDALQGDMLVIG